MEDLVTAVETDKRGALVTVNGEERLWFPREAWAERELSPNEPVSLEELRQWLLPRQYPMALNAAVRLLSVRPRSSGELRERLKQSRYLDETVEMALYKLEKERLLDDEAFAREWAASRAHRQLGKGRILHELLEKGVKREIAERAISALPAEEGAEQAIALAAKLLRRYENEEPQKAASKLMAAMARRGFGFEESREAISRAMARMSEDE